MDGPVELHHYIKLTVDKKLLKKEAKRWFGVVNKYAPNGTVTGHQMKHPENGPANIRLIHKKYLNRQHAYLVPLTRDLRDGEVEKIANVWDKLQKEGDFEIEGSYDSYYYDSQEEKPNDLEKNMDEFANQVAKKIHTKWYNEKIRDGWRYGQLDVENKMHPMMRPYDELPEEKREIDEELPQMFLDYLKHKGYSVIKKTKLDKLASKGSKK